MLDGTIRVRGRLTPTIRRAVRQVAGVAGTATTLWASLADPKEEREAGFQLIPEWLGAMDTDIPGREYGPPLVSGGLLEGRLPNPRATNEVLLDFDLARSLINRPTIVLADELTGEVDTRTAAEIVELLRELNQSEGQTFILVTHDPLVAEATDRTLYLQDGQIVDKERRV